MNPSSKYMVALTKCDDYSDRAFQEQLTAVLYQLDIMHSFSGMTVLLKPNLISSRGPILACTNPQFLAAVVHWFIDRGARVKIGDSPAFGTTSSVMIRHGMDELLKGVEVEMVNFKTPVKRQLANGVEVEIAAEALECDLLVNLPKLKAHSQMYITAAVKNYFGLIVGMRKAMLHMRQGRTHEQFSDMVLGLPDLLGNHISLVDGIEVMHRTGPLDGESLALHCLGGSRFPVALDTALLQVLQLPVARSPLWLAAHRQDRTDCKAENFIYPLLSPEHFHGSGFIAPSDLNPIRFNPFRLLVSSLKRLSLAIRR